MMKVIRWTLGKLILGIDWLTSPKSPNHSAEQQALLDSKTQGMSLYQFKACPFCVKTRRTIRRLGLNIEIRDAKNDPKWREQLSSEGGKLQVPCLMITNADNKPEWLYESDAINDYLTSNFAS